MSRLFAMIALSMLVAAPILAAGPAEQRGLEIAREVDKRDAGFGDFRAEMEMVLKNRTGKTSTRKLRNRTLEMENDGDKLLVLFDRPNDVKGTAFLAFSHRVGNGSLASTDQLRRRNGRHLL